LNYTVTIAGKESTLKYPFSTRSEIEKRLDKGLWDACFSGLIDDQLVILWAGLKHADKKLTPEILAKQIESHVEITGKAPHEIVMTAIKCCLMSKLIKVNEAQLELVLSKIDIGEDDEGNEQGKA
jgi:hypothetical protein